MVRIAVHYPTSGSERFDHDYYRQQHFALCRKQLAPHGLRRAELDVGLPGPNGQPPPFHAIGYLFFDTVEAFGAAFAAAGGPVVADGQNYTDAEPVLQISEHHEM
jgi:uncharacterized protein (TIGR02118 family)